MLEKNVRKYVQKKRKQKSTWIAFCTYFISICFASPQYQLCIVNRKANGLLFQKEGVDKKMQLSEEECPVPCLTLAPGWRHGGGCQCIRSSKVSENKQQWKQNATSNLGALTLNKCLSEEDSAGHHWIRMSWCHFWQGWELGFFPHKQYNTARVKEREGVGTRGEKWGGGEHCLL